MNVLAIDTAGPVIGVGLRCGDVVIARSARITRGAEALLVPWARELVEEAGIAMSDIDAVGVAAGPGAFTGLRVGISTAAGLAMAIGVPLVPVGSLASRRARIADDVPTLTMLDARKGKVYGWAVDEAGQTLGGPADVPPEEAIAWMTPPFVATGEGASVYANLVTAAGGVVADDADDVAVGELARLAAEGLARGEGQVPTSVQPTYLRPPDAKPPKNTGVK